MNRIIKSNRKDYGIAPIIMAVAFLSLLAGILLPFFIELFSSQLYDYGFTFTIIGLIISSISFIIVIFMSFRCPRWLTILVWCIIVLLLILMFQPRYSSYLR